MIGLTVFALSRKSLDIIHSSCAPYTSVAGSWFSFSTCFHEIERDLTIVDCETVKELHEAVKKVSDIKAQLGIK